MFRKLKHDAPVKKWSLFERGDLIMAVTSRAFLMIWGLWMRVRDQACGIDH